MLVIFKRVSKFCSRGVIMNTERKNKLIEYLYPSTSAIDFMFGDLYVELSTILSKKLCFSKDNLNKAVRDKNLELAVYIVNKFLVDNPLYKKRLFEFYPHKDYSVLVGDVIVGYILYITPHINKRTGADVFLDKRSICFSKVSILDL